MKLAATGVATTAGGIVKAMRYKVKNESIIACMWSRGRKWDQ